MNRAKKYVMWLTALGFSLALAVTLTGQVGGDPDGRAASAANATASLQGDSDTSPMSAPSEFGTSDQAITMINGFSFRERDSTTTISGALGGGRWVTGGAGTVLYAPITEIPNGADLSQVVFIIQDTDAALNFQGRLCRVHTQSGVGGDPGADCPFVVDSAGTGNLEVFGNPALQILYRFNIDVDPGLENVSYLLSGNWAGNTNGAIRLHHVRLLWTRRVSPAPAFATFADVPVGSAQHRFVEALVAAGITGGCGGGNYCPGQAVTRGQMAVFISAALGLHWPAF